MTTGEMDKTVKSCPPCAGGGRQVELMIEFHGRLSAGCAVRSAGGSRPIGAWIEPVTPNSLDLLLEVSGPCPPLAAGERLYTLEDFSRLAVLPVTWCSPAAHCGGLWLGKKIAALAQA
jgi:L-alanine-DL-glutamate epimerase-like enolase superfamily enzyme